MKRLLSADFPYYQTLVPADQELFVNRLEAFIRRKQFHLYELEHHPQIPVLVGAAAIQLTFGLRRYKMRFFRAFHIHREAYHTPDSPRRLIGHVANNAVHLSWKHFLEGYGNYSDKQNVGLHELAHALEYSTFVLGSNINRAFVEGFRAFRQTGGSLYYALRINGHPFFSDYAAHSFQEFWAECVECFFEAPEAFRGQIPDLYTIMCRMLNQDPAARLVRLHPGSGWWRW